MGLGIKRSTILKLLLFAGFAFMVGFTYTYHLPKLEALMLDELETLTRERTPLEIGARKLNFHLFPLGVILEDVRIKPKAPLDKYLAPAEFKEIAMNLAVFPLLKGDVRLSRISIRESDINLFLRNDLFTPKGRKRGNGFKLDFEAIYALPIDEISLDNIQIQGRIEPQNTVFRIANLSLTVENRYRSLFVEVNAPRTLIKPSGPVSPLNVQFGIRTLIEAKEIQVSSFRLKADQSFVVASGRFNGDFTEGRIDNGMFDARTKIHLNDANIWDQVFSAKPKLPHLEGSVEADLTAAIRSGKGYKIESELKTRDVVVDKYVVGQVEGHLTTDLKSIASEDLKIQNNAGQVELQKLSLTLDTEKKLRTDVIVKGVSLHELLDDLDVRNVPVALKADAQATCTGAWKDSPQLICQGKVVTTGVHVDSGRPKFSIIVESQEAHVKGEVKVNLQQVEYAADIEVGSHSSGHSEGVINYDTGFKINYRADQIDFKDVKNLVDLKFEGITKLTGTTQGTAKWATIDMNAETRDFWLADYPFGNVNANLKYKTDHLLIEGISGQYGTSRYTGKVDLNLDLERLKLSARVPFMDLKDIQNVFQRKIALPIQFTGTGTGHLEVEGPFRFQDLSYDLHSNFFRGQIAGEAFDEVAFHVKAIDGLVKAQKLQLTKGKGLVEGKGQITPDGQIDAVVIGRSLRIEQLENVAGMGLDLQGLADFTVLIRGQLPHPRVELNGRLSKVVLGDQVASDSVFKLNFLKDRLEGSGQFLGSEVVSDFVIPYDSTSAVPFDFNLKTRQLDVTNLFSLVSRSARQIDFSSSFTLFAHLHSAQGGFWNSSGVIRADEVTLRKGGKVMKASKPMVINVKQGVANSTDCVLTSDDGYLKLDIAGLRRDSLNASLNGKVDLSFVGLLAPFIYDLRGFMAVSIDLKGSALNPNLSGSAYVDRGYVKFNEFYHAFSNIKADILFNNNQILINAMQAEMAGGKLNGEGKIAFDGNSHPVDVKGNFSDVKANIPEGFKTQGSGTVAIQGTQFPYLMSIKYNVTGGTITTEFTDTQQSTAAIRPSVFLPRFLDKENFHPFNLLLDVTYKPIQVNNSRVKASIAGSTLKASGNPDDLLLTGTLTPLPGAKLIFQNATFDVTSALVEYSNSPPKDPKLYVTANTRVSETVVDDQGRSTQNPYEVNLVVQGHGQKPQILLTSLPPLGQREIVSLLAIGVTGASTTADQRQQGNGGAAVGDALLQRTAGAKQLKESLGVDVKMSSSPPTPDNATPPMVTLSKQWTPKFGASASSTVESHPNNHVQLEYKLNKNISTVGTWDARETLQDQQNDVSPNVFGLDLQYKVQFK